jgi:hypothetical protein
MIGEVAANCMEVKEIKLGALREKGNLGKGLPQVGS